MSSTANTNLNNPPAWRNLYTVRDSIVALKAIDCETPACRDYAIEEQERLEILEELYTPSLPGRMFQLHSFHFQYVKRPCIGSDERSTICLKEMIDLFEKSDIASFADRIKFFTDRYYSPLIAEEEVRSRLTAALQTFNITGCDGFKKMALQSKIFPELMHWNQCVDQLNSSPHMILRSIIDPFYESITPEIVDTYYKKYSSCSLKCGVQILIARRISQSYDKMSIELNYFLSLIRISCRSEACLTVVDRLLEENKLSPMPSQRAIDRAYVVLGLSFSSVLLFIALLVAVFAFRWSVIRHHVDIVAIYLGAAFLLASLLALWIYIYVHHFAPPVSMHIVVLILQGLTILILTTVLGVRFLFAAAFLFGNEISARPEKIIWIVTSSFLALIAIGAVGSSIAMMYFIFIISSGDYVGGNVRGLGNWRKFVHAATQVLGLTLPSLAVLVLLATFVLSLVTLFKARSRPGKEWRNKSEDMRALFITSAILLTLLVLVAFKLSVNAMTLPNDAYIIPEWYLLGLSMVGVDSLIAGVFLLFAFLAFRASHISKQKREEMIELHGHKTPLLEGEIPEQYDV